MNNIRHHPVDELELMAYLDGELSRERAATAAAHLETCTECKALAADLRGVSQELAGWQIESSNAQLTARLSVALEEHERLQEKTAHDSRMRLRILWPRQRVWPWALPAAAVVLISVVSIPNLLVMHRRAPSELAERRLSTYTGPTNKSRAEVAPPTAQPSPPPTVTLNYSDDSLADLTQVAPGVVSKQEKNPAHAGAISENSGLLVPSGPMVVRTAELSLTTTDFDQSRARIEETLKKHRGYLGDLTVSGNPSSARILTATLRVPADQLDVAMAELKSLGRVESESQKGEEVSQQYVDLEARLLNARNSEQRLTELLRRAGKLSDVLEVEQQIESVRESIERMDAERKNLARQVAFSTVNMKIAEDYRERVQVVPDSTSTRLRNAAVEGYEMMVSGLINLLLFLVSWGPSLLLWGAILFFPVRWLWRRLRRGLV